MHVALVKFLYNDALVLISQCKLILGCNSSMLKMNLSLILLLSLPISIE